MGTPLGRLRATAHALCENESIKAHLVKCLGAVRDLRNLKIGNECPKITDHVALIEQATAQELLGFRDHVFKDNQSIRMRFDDCLQALRYAKPADATIEAADSTNLIKNASVKETHNIMLALCEEDDIKKRVVTHLRVLGLSMPNGHVFAEVDGGTLISEATELELHAIGLVMTKTDGDIKKRVSESLQVLLLFAELQEIEAELTSLLKCLKC